MCKHVLENYRVHSVLQPLSEPLIEHCVVVIGVYYKALRYYNIRPYYNIIIMKEY